MNPVSLNAKPASAQSSNGVSGSQTVESCSSSATQCEATSLSSGGAITNPFALNAVENFQTFGYTVEPPDQGLCANNQYVMEILNIGILQVYSASSLKPLSGVASMDNLMGLNTLSWSSAGDVSCLYDYSNGGHWFITEFVSTTPETPGPSGQPGPFQGCFVAVPDTCREGIAVSVGNNPLTTSWNVYFLDPNFVNCDPGSHCGPAGTDNSQLLNDYAKQGTTRDAWMLFYDEFNLGALPTYCSSGSGFGCNGFNGAQEFAFGLNALETGQPAKTVTVAYENMGTAANLYPIPANGAFQPQAFDCTVGVCWYQVIPAQTPDASQFDNTHGGTGWMVATLDFFGAGDNRVAAFDWTGLSNLNSAKCKTCSGIAFGGTLYTTPQITYRDEGLACLVQYGGFCGLGAQKGGPIPLGDNCGLLGLSQAQSCPESGLASNGDGATQASYAHGHLWAAVSTGVAEKSGLHLGAAFWAIGSTSVAGGGYVAAGNADIEFPSIAATDGGNALMSFTLSGPGYYPSTAYTVLTGQSVIHVTATGKSPSDSATEYQFWPGLTRPRWGDYGQAIFVPSTGGHGNVYFSAEYIQYQNCGDQAFLSGATNGNQFDAITCGGTRTLFANWGTAISYVAAS
ncbi:MAG TPA: hypothetical protein VFF30_10930 [Nitrososphaerales archaeon]|nr:hypothetical protein [Nitrososphaerales archaeon]